MYLATDGNNNDQFEYMQKNWQLLGKLPSEQGVFNKKTCKALNSTMPKTIKNRLPAMVTNENECKHIMRYIVKLDSLRLV